MNTQEKWELQKHAVQIRKGIIDSVYHAHSGHPGGSLSAADVLTYLYFREMHINPAHPDDVKRDRFVLSKGHAAPALYATLAERGFFAKEDLLTLRKLGSHLQGHPNKNTTPGVDMTTGSLGQGISAAVGMALAFAMDYEKQRVYALLGDGELEEGQVWEAITFAVHRKLDHLCLIVDNNNLQIDGPIEQVAGMTAIAKKLTAFGLAVQTVNGHDFNALEKAFETARETTGKPSALVLQTVKGKGVSFMENQVGWHGTAPNEKQYQAATKELAQKAASLEREGLKWNK